MKKLFAIVLFLASIQGFAASSFTEHYDLEKPSDGSTTWGAAIRDGLDTIDTQLYVNSTSTSDHLADTVGAHASTAISTAGGSYCSSSTTVEAYLDCLDSQINIFTGASVLPIANGGTNNSTAYTEGSVVFSNGTSLTQDNSNLFWNNTSDRLGIGTASPAERLHLKASGTDVGAKIETSAANLAAYLELSDGTTDWYVVNRYSAPTSGFGIGTSNSGDLFQLTTTGAATFSSTVTAAGFVGNLTGNASGTSATFTGALTGDVTSSGMATTLATVNSNVGSFGSSTSIPSFTVNAKGLITAASSNVVVAPAGTLTGTTLAATVVTSSLTSVGTLSGLTVTAAPTFSALTATRVPYAGTAGLLSDSANFVWDNTNARLDIGGNATPATSYAPQLFLDTAGNAGSAGNPAILIQGVANKEKIRIQTNTSGAGGLDLMAAPSGTIASPGTTTTGNILGVVQGGGYNSSAWVTNRSRLQFNAEALWTTTSTPTFVSIHTTPVGSTTLTEVTRWQSTGDERFTAVAASTVPINTTSQMGQYQTGTKFVLWYNDGGTMRYKYLDMSGTGVTWVHTTTAP